MLDKPPRVTRPIRHGLFELGEETAKTRRCRAPTFALFALFAVQRVCRPESPGASWLVRGLPQATVATPRRMELQAHPGRVCASREDGIHPSDRAKIKRRWRRLRCRAPTLSAPRHYVCDNAGENRSARRGAVPVIVENPTPSVRPLARAICGNAVEGSTGYRRGISIVIFCVPSVTSC